MNRVNSFLRTVVAIATGLAVSTTVLTGCFPGEEKQDGSDKLITSFVFLNPPAIGVINHNTQTIAVSVPVGTTVTALAPVIVVSEGASVSPASGVQQDFSAPVVYTVTAADASTTAYVVTVMVESSGNTNPNPNPNPNQGADPTDPGEGGTKTALKSPINVNTTLKDLGPGIDYVYTGGGLLTVNTNATLTIEPGVVIQFTQSGGGLNIGNGSTIKAIGTSAAPILLIGGTTKGSWRGMEIYSNTANELVYVEFQNAGSSTSYGAVWIDNNTQLSMSHCLIDGGKAYGVQADPGAVFPVFQYNTIKNCDKSPVYLYDIYTTAATTAFDNTNVYTANTGTNGNAIEIGTGAVKSNLTVKNTGMETDYVFSGGSRVSVQDNATLTVAPGVTIKFTQTGGGLTISNNSCLKMQGTASDRIRLIGGATKGSWERVEIYGYTDNIIEYTDFVNGGYSTSYGVIWTDNNTKLSMNNCLIDGGKAYGLYCDPGTEIPSFSTNTIKNCDKAPVLFYSISTAAAFDMTSDFTGNTNDYVEIGSGAVAASLSIKQINVPYYVSAGFSVNAQLSIGAGATFWMGNNIGINITSPNGRLNITGTSANHVKFTRPTGTSYYWDNIELYTLGNTFDYVDFDCGGNSSSYGTIWIDNNLSLALSNSSVKNSRYWGIVMDPSSSITCTAVTFSNNASGHVKLPSGQPSSAITEGVAYTGTLK
ncbi:MAG: DUF5018 domain-containing protein [Bacteroidales bacterium]|nr:DUF5018 domain-containing protein [Bacteroidales bacterium]